MGGKLEDDARGIFLAGVSRVEPSVLLEKTLRVEGDMLVACGPGAEIAYDLRAYRRVVAVGMGKASAFLAKSLEGLLGERLWGGFVVTKALSGVACSKIELAEAGHPLPDARSEAAGRKVLALAEQVRAWEAAGEHTLVIVLVSGGGSALLAVPAAGLSLEDKKMVAGLLLGSGATIQEMNTVRKHLSRVKGGRLAEAFAPADLLSLVLSDVVGDDLDAIASGPTVPDTSTWEAAAKVLQDREVWEDCPAAVRRLMSLGRDGKVPDTPKVHDACFARTKVVFVGNNMLALKAAEEEARRRGYRTLALTSGLVGEAREMAGLFLSIARDVAVYGKPIPVPACVLTGGETTVTLRGKGLGGRNQELTLAVLAGLKRGAPGHGELLFLSAGTDGNDGPTDAAGAFASWALRSKAEGLGLDPKAYLADNDSYHFFDEIGGLLRTGATGTNVCDLQILLLPGAESRKKDR